MTLPKEAAFERVIRLLDEKGNERYIAWVRQLLVVASGSLALLVAFHHNLAPEQAQQLWLLRGCWIGLSATVLFGLFMLFWDARSYFRAGDRLRRVSTDHGIEAADREGERFLAPPRWGCLVHTIFLLLFGGSYVLLIAFAWYNTR